jgi:natural product biosynthesis luciferase-like monooxygenase protein
VLSPKVRGVRVLEQVLGDTPLDFFALCSSRSSILGGFGQVDYCAGNAFLDAFAHEHARHHSGLTVSIDWDAWAEVGMLVDTAAQYGLGPELKPVARNQFNHPLLDRYMGASNEEETFTTTVSPATHWVLDDHRIVGTAIMPGTAYLEMARAALEQQHRNGDENSIVEIRDAFFLSPLGLRNDETREVRTVLKKDGEGYQFSVVSRSTVQDGDDAGWQTYSIGNIAYVKAETPRRLDLEALRARCSKDEIIITDDHEVDPDLGPRWQSLRQVYRGEKELLARLELAEEFDADFARFKLHPALLDRATGTAKHYLVNEGVYLPMSYERLQIYGPLPRKIFAYIKFRDDDVVKKETITFDIVLTDEQGVARCLIDGFSQKRVNDTAAPLRVLDGVKIGETKTGEARGEEKALPSIYEKNRSASILPHEGLDAFSRILLHEVPPQIVVSTRDLQQSIGEMKSLSTNAVVAEIEKLGAARTLTARARPQLHGDYVAPRNEVERTLAGILETMLGVDQVGIHDNFFELGGDSVLGTQTIAQASRKGLHITPQQIFQHPTVEEMASIAVSGPGTSPAATAVAQSALDASQVENESAPRFSLVELDEDQVNKLAKLIGDDGADEGPLDLADSATLGSEPRFAPENVEAILRQHPEVRDAAVIVAGGYVSDTDLTAYVVLRNGESSPEKEIDFSLFFFAADNWQPGEHKYRLYLEGARFADEHGFSAVWTPERHFHESGGPYPNPSVLSAALATITRQVQLRAGSVVLPLHHAMRVAEEWSVVDNLSNGRVGVSFTSGWIPNDFAFFPERFANKREEMFRGIAEVQQLWRGEAITARDGADKPIQLQILPRPVQAELPIWLTCSGDPEMFVKAGEHGFNVLTALLSQSIDDVAKKVSLYRQTLAQHGHDPDAGRVTLMMHTFVGDTLDDVVAKARAPLCNYLKAHVGLIETMTKSLEIDVGIDREKYLDDLVGFAFERYYQTASLIGTPEKCRAMIERLKQVGVDEVACFIDFGVDTDSVLEGLQHLRTLKDLSVTTAAPGLEHTNSRMTEILSKFLADKLRPSQLAASTFRFVKHLPPDVKQESRERVAAEGREFAKRAAMGKTLVS